MVLDPRRKFAANGVADDLVIIAHESAHDQSFGDHVALLVGQKDETGFPSLAGDEEIVTRQGNIFFLRYFADHDDGLRLNDTHAELLC